MTARLLQMILGTVFLGVGLPFLVLGVALDEDVFLLVGAAFTALGVALLAVFALARRRERAWLAGASRTEAEVVDARIKPYVRMGSMLTVDLTVRMRGRTLRRRVLLPPTMAIGPGDTIEVLYDPEQPDRFAPAVMVEHRLRERAPRTRRA